MPRPYPSLFEQRHGLHAATTAVCPRPVTPSSSGIEGSAPASASVLTAY
ncbi:hypothetical protein [Tessaracoccus sp. MC1756]|nr:hypothetical protein [Tessaracoccus sp. MC1756]MBB1510744.1 hypothetical protein [Tessaracoccus sp. MC1756]